MNNNLDSTSDATSELAHESATGSLGQVIDHVSHLLPAQGPITVFIHHNTLHAFEDLPFHEAVKKGGHIFGCQPYLTEERYREELRRGRIRFSDLQDVLTEDLGETADHPVPCFGTRLNLYLTMLQYPLLTGPTEELIWFVAEANALRRVRQETSSAIRDRLIAETRRWVIRDLRASGITGRRGESTTDAAPVLRVPASLAELLERFDDSKMETWTEDDWEGFTLQALWRVCCEGVWDLPPYTPPPEPTIRHRDLLFKATGVDSDVPVHDLLIRFCAAFLDQGFAPWRMPGREGGFYRAFLDLYRDRTVSPDYWRRDLTRELTRLDSERISPMTSIRESLDALGVPEAEWSAFLSETFLALRGWGGMVQQVEIRGDRAVHPIPSGSLVEFLAIRLLLDRFSIAYCSREAIGYEGPLQGLRDTIRSGLGSVSTPSAEQRAFPIFQLAQVMGFSPNVLHHLEPDDWSTLVREIESFSVLERRRIFHMAYERRFTTQTLDAISLHAPQTKGRPPGPPFQVVCCLDEREESFRRHLEELVPEVETFGAAGFYSVAMYYKGAAAAHFVPLCPVVIRPQHWVVEQVAESLGKSHRRRARTRRVLGTASHQFHVGSRTFALGAILTGTLGVFASFPLIARILFPRLTARIRRALGKMVETPPITELRLERKESPAGPGANHVGYSIEEMTNIGERLLRDIGLIDGFSRLVIPIGHGSDSLNNPHNSAYNCGACGGSAGGPNARALAEILNDHRIREGLRSRGLTIPDETVFVGAYHNTCNDTVIYYDLDRLPESHREEFAAARKAIDEVCTRNAHERCRRFMSASLALSYNGAHQHVEERSEDLAQTRPELGHATNAITIVGRREWSRGLFLDRRAFLTSYDPSQDDAEGTILTRILQAVFPVCSGINLEYYFSNVDNNGFGAGTKLPHNISALLGVMDGAASDLRTGLPWQMVEIHEPVRSLFIIETTAAIMTMIIERNPGIGQLCQNEWIQLALVDPTTRAISIYRDGSFQPYHTQATDLPRAVSSVDWYRGWRDHLEFAEIVA